MPIQDTPINAQSPLGFQDTPISVDAVNISSEETRGLASAQAAYIQNYLDGSSVLDNYRNYLNSLDPERSLQDLSQQKAQADSEALTEELVLNPAGATGNIEDQVNAVRAALTTVSEQSTDPDFQFVEALSDGTSSEEVLRAEAAKAKMFKFVADFEEELGVGDYFMDFGKGLLPFINTIEGYRVTGDVLGQDEEIQAASRGFQSLDVEQQAAMLPAIAAELREKTGDVEALRILNNLVRPFGDEDVESFDDLTTGLDIASLAGVTIGGTTLIRSLKQSYNLVKTMRRVGNEEEAVRTTTAALVDDSVRQGTGMSPLTPTSNALPFDTSIEDIGRTGDLSGPVMEELETFFGRADRTAQDIIEGNGFLREGIMNTRQRAALEAEAEAKLRAEKAENIERISETDTSTTFSYRARDEDGNISEQTYTLDLSLDNAGLWNQSEASTILQAIGSPTAFAKGLVAEDVATAQRIDYLTARVNRQLNELTLEAIRPIGLTPTAKTKAALARVDRALREGDEFKNADGTRGTVFDADTLRTNYQLEPNEISSYYRINRLYNNLWRIRNAEKREELAALNYRNINFSRNGEASVGKSYDNAQTANGSLRSNQIDYLYDAELDEIIDLNKAPTEFLSNAYADNKILVRMDEGYDIGGDRGRFSFALVSADDVTDLPQVVLQRKRGYVPRIYEDITYFVKRSKEVTVNHNRTEKVSETLRFFDNKKEADEFVESLIEKEVARGDAATPEAQEALRARLREQYNVLGDREIEKLSAASGEVGHGSGGLYTGARAQDDILFGLNGDKAARVNSFEALTRNVGNVSRLTSINQWRLGLEQRWINTANAIFKSKGLERKVEHFQRLESIAEDVDEVRFLNRMHDQIRDWQNFPTQSEQFFQTTMRNMYNWAKNNNHQRLAKVFGNLRDLDPVAAARATAFHGLLGWLNPSQAWVQAQGASVALSLGLGKYSARALRHTAALTALGEGALDSGRFANAARAAATKGLRVEPSELEEMHRLWVKTGYQDSVVQTADHAAAAKGYGLTLGTIKRAADRGLFFYRRGELFTRRLSFSIALERWKEANNVASVKGLSDDALKSVMDDANNMMLNMTRANRANWQKGVLSLPFQFLQVTTKFLETATGLNGQFKKGEIGRILAGQIFLYGTAGIPLVGLGTMMASELFGLSQADIENNPGLVKSFNDGFWGAVGHWMLGVDVEMSSRGSLLRGMGDFVDNWFVRESTFTEKALGAFGAVGQRWATNLGQALRPITTSPGQAIDWTTPYDLLVSPVLNSVSTFTNAEKALYMELLDTSYSSAGYPIETRDFSFMEVMAQAAGFQTTNSNTLHDLRSRERALKSLEKSITEALLKSHNEFALRYPNGDAPEEEIQKQVAANEILYGALPYDSQQRISENLLRVYSGDTGLEQARTRYINTMQENTVEDLSAWHAAFVGNGVIRIGVDLEEEE